MIQKGRILNARLDCEASNRPGQKGEHRNGALTLQVMDSKNHSFDAFTRGAAQKTEIYIEYSVFALHRHGLCY